MRKGERRDRPEPRAAAEQAWTRWVRRYPVTVGPLEAAVDARRATRYAWHAAVRWARQDERRRRGESRMAVLLKGRN